MAISNRCATSGQSVTREKMCILPKRKGQTNKSGLTSFSRNEYNHLIYSIQTDLSRKCELQCLLLCNSLWCPASGARNVLTCSGVRYSQCDNCDTAHNIGLRGIEPGIHRANATARAANTDIPVLLIPLLCGSSPLAT